MRHLTLLVAMLAFVPLSMYSAETKSAETKLPSEALKVMEKLEKSEGKLTFEYKKSVNQERGKAINDLQKSLKDLTKSGDLDGALAVKKQIEDLQAKIIADDDTDLLGNKKKVDIAKLMLGTWTWQKSNGVGGTFEAFADGRIVATITSPIAFPYVPAKWEAKEDKILMTWLNDPTKLDTLSFTAENKLAGDTHDVGKNSFNASKDKPGDKDK